MMGATDARNMWSNLEVSKYLHTVASRWISSTYYCLSYPECKYNLSCVVSFVTCDLGLSGCTLFFRFYLTNVTIFGKILLIMKCVF